MKKVMSVVMATVFVAGLSLTAANAFAGGACCASKEAAKATKASADGSTSIMKVSDGGSCATKASASAAGSCTMKSSMAGLLKSAPGTTMKYSRIDGGIALVVTAASKEYVPVVQQAMVTNIDHMKLMSGAACPTDKAGMVKVSDGASCATKAGMTKVSDGATCATKASASASAHCATGAVKTEQASMECPDWMKVLCTATCSVENTATGVKIVWTATEKSMVEQVQVAGEKLHADLSL